MSDEAISRAVQIAIDRVKNGDGSYVENRPSKWEQLKDVLWDSNLNTPIRAAYNLFNTPTEVLLGDTGPAAEKAVADSFDAAGSAMTGSAPIPKPANAVTAGIRAYHVSPHLFDRFKWGDEVRGTGEGVQMYGDGLYFAENPKVSGPGGHYWDQFHGNVEDPALWLAGKYLNNHKFNKQYAIDTLENDVNYAKYLFSEGGNSWYPEGDKYGPAFRFGPDALNALKSGVKIPPHGYVVDLNTAPESLVRLNKKMHEQGDPVKSLARYLGYDMPNVDGPKPDEFMRELMKNLVEQMPPDSDEFKHFVANHILNFNKNPSQYSHMPFYKRAMKRYDLERDPFENRAWGQDTGTDFQNWVNNNQFEPEEYQEIAKKKGVHGNMYDDGLSRALSDGKEKTSNFVIWDPEIIDIKDRFASGGVIPTLTHDPHPAKVRTSHADGGPVEDDDKDSMNALTKAEGLSSYNPSWTDMVAQKLLGDGRKSTWWNNVVQNLTGSTGLGSTGYVSAKDFVPVVGQVLGAQQAYHDDKPWSEVGLNLLPAMSTTGREAMIAADAVAKAAPEAAEGAVDLARRSLLGMRPKPVEPQVPTSELKTDFRVSNPGGDWLKDKQETAQRHLDAGMKAVTGPDTAWVGSEGDYTLPVDVLSTLPGANDEVRVPGDVKYDALMKSVTGQGVYHNDSPVTVAVNHKGQAFLKDGNTRTAVARDLGIDRIPAQVYWLNGAEETPGPWHPDNVLPKLAPRPTDPTPITTSNAAAPTASTSFLDKPVTRRMVNEGIAGAGAAAVLGPEYVDDLLRSSLKFGDNALPSVAEKVAEALSPDTLVRKLTDILHRPVSATDPLIQKYIREDALDNFGSPFSEMSTLGDDSVVPADIEIGHMVEYPNWFMDADTQDGLDAMRAEYRANMRKELEEEAGRPLTDDEFGRIYKKASLNHEWSTDLRRDTLSFADPDTYMGSEIDHPVNGFVNSLITRKARESNGEKIPTKAQFHKMVHDNMTPEAMLKYHYGVPDEEIPAMLDTDLKGYGPLRKHLQLIIDDAYDSGFVDDILNADETWGQLKHNWARGAHYEPYYKRAAENPDEIPKIYEELKSKWGVLRDKAVKDEVARIEKFESMPSAKTASNWEEINADPEYAKLSKAADKSAREVRRVEDSISQLHRDFYGVPSDRLPSFYDAVKEYRAKNSIKRVEGKGARKSPRNRQENLQRVNDAMKNVNDALRVGQNANKASDEFIDLTRRWQEEVVAARKQASLDGTEESKALARKLEEEWYADRDRLQAKNAAKKSGQ